MSDCTECGTRLSHNDETTKLTEYVCPRCHRTTIVWKPSYRVTA
jgi:DNA-directed RNA polymerase subunit RPC12/RpoP